LSLFCSRYANYFRFYVCSLSVIDFNLQTTHNKNGNGL